MGDPGHLAVVRAAIADLGYDGYDPKLTAAALDDLFGPDHAIARVKLAMIERRAGRCAAAVQLWSQAIKDLTWNAPGEAEWYARAKQGLGLCALAAGKPALDFINGAWVHGNHDQLRFAMAIAVYESGDRQTAYGLFLVASRVGDPAVKSGMQAWLSGTGLAL